MDSRTKLASWSREPWAAAQLGLVHGARNLNVRSFIWRRLL